MDDILKSRKYAIEHTLVMYAKDAAIISPQLLYTSISDAPTKKVIDMCHIYFIGVVPSVEILDVHQKGNKLCFTFNMAEKNFSEMQLFELRPGSVLHKTELHDYYIQEVDGEKTRPSVHDVLMAIKKHVHSFDFKILYIGQAYGEEGQRNAIDRLLSHSTLQKISLTEEVPQGYRLEIVLIGIENSYKLVTGMNPFAIEHDTSQKRISNGLDMLFGTNEAQRVSLYEATLIRYFQPKYNTHFKDSFPSTNLKVLEQCYDKDMQAVVAEVCFDHFLYSFHSDVVISRDWHIAEFDIHTDEGRKSFFSK